MPPKYRRTTSGITAQSCPWLKSSTGRPVWGCAHFVNNCNYQMKNQKLEVLEKNIKHTFTLEERDEIGGRLAQALGSFRCLESEFDQVKASYKSKITEAESLIGSLQTDRVNGFCMRKARVTVEYFPKDRVKKFYLEGAPEDADPVLTEPMTAEDFQADLIRSEGKFECRTEFELFPIVGGDYGFLVVGRFSKKWFTALRVRVGAKILEEHLDAEQKSVKQRYDAITQALKRYQAWLIANLGKDNAAGFQDGIHKLITSQKEIAE